MCGPLAAGGLALSALSTLAHSQAEGERSRARSDVTEKERQRQQAYQDQSNQLFNDSLARVDRTRQEQDTKAAEDKRTTEATNLIEGSAAPVNPSDNSTPTDSSVVKSANARELLKALKFGKTRAARSAAVNAYGDTGLGVGIDLGRFGAKQAQIGGNAVRSANLLPGEIEGANTKGGVWDAIGTGLGMAGQLTGAAGAFGGGGSWGDLFGGAAKDVNPAATAVYGSPRPAFGSAVRGRANGRLGGGV